MSGRDSLTLRAEVARKALHVATAALPVALALGSISQPALRAIITAAVAVALVIEVLRFRWPAFSKAFVRAVGPMLRVHERGVLTGATWLAISMALVLWLAPLHAAVSALWAAAAGDAAAALVGRGVSRPQAATGKTLIGSLAALAVTTAGVLWLTPASIVVALLLGIVAALAERPAVPLDDNLRIALAVALAAMGLGLR